MKENPLEQGPWVFQALVFFEGPILNCRGPAFEVGYAGLLVLNLASADNFE
jgi:hypothetical protein